MKTAESLHQDRRSSAVWMLAYSSLAVLLATSACLVHDVVDVQGTTGEAIGPSSDYARAKVVQLKLTKPADNSPCMVCHMDFAEEELTAKHVPAGVGCTFCHGTSQAHGGDESNIITPDVLFGRTEITSFCKQCHPTHVKSAKYAEFVVKWQDERRPNGRIISADSACTDCHGNHAILRPDQMEFVPME